MSDEYTIHRQPLGVERVWKALERLRSKDRRNVPEFRSRLELGDWIANVRGQHAMRSDLPKAIAYAKFLESVGIALVSPLWQMAHDSGVVECQGEPGWLIDLERLAQLRAHTSGDGAWETINAEQLADRAQVLERKIILVRDSSQLLNPLQIDLLRRSFEDYNTTTNEGMIRADIRVAYARRKIGELQTQRKRLDEQLTEARIELEAAMKEADRIQCQMDASRKKE